MDKKELQMLQALPLDIKIAKSKLRIEEFVRHVGGEDKVHIAFSGGKDSTVLLHLVRTIYPNIKAVFSNTGLEYPELVRFAKSHDNVIEVRPKVSFKQVIENHGYPMVSKKVSRMIYDLKNPTEANATTRRLYLSPYRLKGGEIVYTEDADGNKVPAPNKTLKLPKKWEYLIDAPFSLTNKCCDELKKKPMKEYQKAYKTKPIVGTMAIESKYREDSYLRIGCNNFREGAEACTPLGFWTEQDILNYLYTYNVPYCSVYGEILKEEVDGKVIFRNTGERRTGCIFCGFGIHLEKGENRYQRLERTHPQLHDYCMNKLGFKDVCEYMGIKYTAEDTQLRFDI